MSVAEAEGRRIAVFSPKVILALILVGVFSMSALAVLTAYAPDLRTGSDGGAHALSKSAVGYAGAVALVRAHGAPTVVSRSPGSGGAGHGLLVLTPPPGTSAKALQRFGQNRPILLVLPKWAAIGDGSHPGWVRKVDVLPATATGEMLKDHAKSAALSRRTGVTTPRLISRDAAVAPGLNLPLAPIDRLQTIAGAGLTPVLVDEQGRTVLARAGRRDLYVLSDPDLLNTQGLKPLQQATAALEMIDALRGSGGVTFDVSLNGFERERSLLRTMLEPPLLGATLCLVAAALLAALHAFARFGPAAGGGRALALGNAALVDNSAALVKLARKEARLLPTYAELTQMLAQRAAGGHAGLEVEDRTSWLAKLGRARGAGADLRELTAQAETARSRSDVLSIARKLHQWRLEVTRERR